MRTNTAGKLADIQIHATVILVRIEASVPEVAKMMTMISAAEFENRMKGIYYSKKSDAEKDREAKELVQEVLKDMGYDAGCIIWERLLRVTSER